MAFGSGGVQRSHALLRTVLVDLAAFVPARSIPCGSPSSGGWP